MCYHEWSDEWFEKYGHQLGAAEHYIYKFVYRWSRCYLISKEKYGTIRYEHLFPPYGGFYIRPNWINKCLSLLGKKRMYSEYFKDGFIDRQRFYWHESWLYYKWNSWGRFILKIAVKRACKKWPDVKKEILDDADFMRGEWYL